MKAVILEIKDSFAAVLSDDGCIVKVKNNNYEIGQVIQMNNPKIRFTKKIVAFAASAAALVVFGVGTWAYASPYTYVSLDVNPSIEYSVNRFDRVLNVKAVNDDGEEILQKINLDDLENNTIQDALTKTVEQISESGYFDGDIEGGIVITTSGEDQTKAEDLAQNLKETVENEVEDNGDKVEVDAASVALERVEQARELGVTPGKLNLVEKLQAAAPDPSSIVLNDWLNKPVKEIMKATKDYRKAATVSGSAIVIDTKAADNSKAADKTEKATAKAEKAQVKATDKAKETADKTIEKAKEAEIKATEKAKEAQEKATEKAKQAAEKANKVSKAAAEKAKKDTEKAKEAEAKATQAVKKAEEKANEEVQKADDENTDEVEKANDHSNGNSNSSNQDTDTSQGNSGNSNNGKGHN